jgi:MFS family permease
MLSICQLTTPLGVFVGYLIASECIYINEDIGWKFSFVIQSVIIILMILLLYRVSKNLFESKLISYKDDKNIIDTTFFKLSESLIMDQDTTIDDIINLSYFKQIFSNKNYVLSIFSISCLYYTVTGVQYWAGDYMNRVLKIHSPQKRLLNFSIICFTSPTLAVLIAGYSVNKLQGGYNNIKVYDICFYLSIFTFTCGILSTFMSNEIFFILFTWIAFFFGGGMMPILIGIIITSLPQHLRASGNSLQLFFGTLLGYLPSPYVYGALEDFFDDGGKKSYFANMIPLFACVILLGYNRKIKYEKNNENMNENNNNNNKDNNNNNFSGLINIEENGQTSEEVQIK